MNLDPYARMIERLSGRVDTKPVFRWATVTQTQPLLIQLDGDPAPLLGSPSNAGPKVYLVGERVRVELQNGRATVHTAANRVENVRGATAQRVALAMSGAAVQGMRFYDTDENQEYEWSGTAWITPHDLVLWEGGPWYLNNTQSVPLTSPVSAQKTGIVMLWQPYVGGVAEEHNFNYLFVPKSHTQFSPGVGVRLILRNGGTLLTKYVYVNDATLAGHADNAVTPNNFMVITRVLGV